MIWRGWRREMLDRAQTTPDRDNDGFEERALWLGTTFGGAGRLHADLTPACAAALTVVLEALGQKAGPEDTRTAAQRRHDAVEEACRRLIGGQMIPGRDGQPPHLTVHIDLGDLRRPPGGSALERSWTPAKAAAGPGSAYLTGAAAEAAACDAVLTTIVTGQIDWQVLDQLTTVWLTAHGHGHAGGRPEDHPDGTRESQADGRPEDHAGGRPEDHADGRPEDHADGPRENRDANQPAASTGHVPFPGSGHGPGSGTGHPLGPGRAPAATHGRDCAISGCLEATRQRLQATILRWSLDLLSGPGGLASQLRGTLLGAPFSTPSQPLDLGRATRTIPPAPAHRRHPARPALPVPRLHPATVRLRRAPPDPLGQRRPHQPGKPPIAM